MIDKKEAFKKFEEVYESKILPNITTLEKRRSFTKIFICCYIGLFLICFKLMTTIYTEKMFLIVIILCCTIFILGITLNIKFESNYIKTAKARLLQPILSIFNFTHSINIFNFNLEEFGEMGLFPKARYNYEDDALAGIINKTSVYISESKLYHYNDTIGMNICNGFSNERTKKGINTKLFTYGNKKDCSFDHSGLIIKIAKRNIFKGIFIKQELMDYSQIPNLLRPLCKNIDSYFTNPETKLYKKLNLSIIKKDGLKENILYHSDNKIESEKFFNSQIFEKLEKIKKIFPAEKLRYAVNNQAIYLFIEAIAKVEDVYHGGHTNYFEFGNQYNFTSLHNKQLYINLFSQIYRLATAIDYLTTEEQKDINEI